MLLKSDLQPLRLLRCSPTLEDGHSTEVLPRAGVVACAEDREDEAQVVLHPPLAILRDAMGTDDPLQTGSMQEPLRDIRAPQDTGAPGVGLGPKLLSGIRPEKILKDLVLNALGAYVWTTHLRCVDRSNVVRAQHATGIPCQATMDNEDFVVQYMCKRQGLVPLLQPHKDGSSVLVHTLLEETSTLRCIPFVQLGVLVVAPGEHDAIRILHEESKQQAHNFRAVVSFVDEISSEEISNRLRRLSMHHHEREQIVQLPAKVTNYDHLTCLRNPKIRDQCARGDLLIPSMHKSVHQLSHERLGQPRRPRQHTFKKLVRRELQSGCCARLCECCSGSALCSLCARNCSTIRILQLALILAALLVLSGLHLLALKLCAASLL
mmetsp:Transcript_72437/g.155102  ORF Transcript_72437/g.155102 Transcript_72437/m.155102 type:complete len:378 (+) Transcript_72437:1637-2770(+)